MSAVATAPTVVEFDPANDLDHVVCCEVDRLDSSTTYAFCGTDVTNTPWVDLDASPHLCQVCIDMESADFCPRYGRCPNR